ncbi:MAG: hypothetical protein ACLFQV_06850 [Vulcanimicrobiota bacterium]
MFPDRKIPDIRDYMMLYSCHIPRGIENMGFQNRGMKINLQNNRIK